MNGNRRKATGFMMAALAVPAWHDAASAAEPRVQTAPAPVRCVTGESLRLSAAVPKRWSSGTPLRGLLTNGRIPANGALDPASVVLRRGGERLAEGKHYLIDKEWGMLGVAPGSPVTPEDAVTADYCYSLRRIDSLVRTADGKQLTRQGEAHLTIPVPPELGAGERRIANLYVPYFSDGTAPEVLPILEPRERAATATTPGLLPRALARIQAGKPVKVVCWGDSVTVGGDASSPETRYTGVLQTKLNARFPGSPIRVETVAVGGTNSRQWLYPDKYRHTNPEVAAQIRWERIVEAKPDVVTIEFVNDSGLPPADVEKVYTDIRERIHALGAEIVLITPHFTMMEMMKFQSFRDKEARPYVLALRQFAARHRIALADASARWEHLWKEGIPYMTLLNNGINHPDDRGHLMFAEELISCFEP